MTISNRSAVIYTALLVLAVSLLNVGCKKKSNDDDSNNAEPEKVGYADDQLLLEHINNSSNKLVEKALLLGAEAIGSCVSITYFDKTNEGGLTPDSILIRFGAAGSECLCYDGKIRTGSIIVSYNKETAVREQGYHQVLKYNNYTVNGYLVSGHRTLTNVGRIAAGGRIQYNVKRVDTVVLPNDQGVITGSSNRVRIWHYGSNTEQLADDVYVTTGSGTFIRANGDQYTTQIKEALYSPASCNWITNGTMNIYPVDARHRILDYGGGECENDATINVNGVITSLKAPQ